ncbi:MAG: spermidine synthase [Alphaproteobacteria bacterium]|nr:spermidine synthase [Alphaproteobacteria bacterium]
MKLRSALFALFFVSGFAALVYQTAWHRLLGLFAGADTIAAALVVGAFLLGLGIGSLVAGLYADRLSRRRALLAFAICEVGIAVFAAASPWIFYDGVYRTLLPVAESRGAVFAVVFAGLLWPTFLMGCSLPFLSKAVVQRLEGSAELIGWLYGMNTLGAGVGAFVGGWFLIGTVGFDVAVWIGATLNLAVAAGGLWLARGTDLADEAAPPARSVDNAADRRLVLEWSTLVFISGFLIVALQIVWYRLAGVLLQSNGYSFSLVLAVFLLGDAAGLLVGARWIPRISDPRRFFFGMQAAAAALALGGAWAIYGAIGAGLLPATFVDHDIVSGRAGDTALIALLLAVVVLPASFVMGLSFPVVQKAVQRDIGRLGQRVGLVQLSNIVGNSAGSLVAGLLLLDLLGTSGTLKLLIAIGLAFAVLPLASGGSARWLLAPASLLAAGLVLFPSGETFWRRLHGLAERERAIVREDKTGLSLLKFTGEQSGRLYIQGHSQSSLPFATVHAFLGAVGPLTHPDPRRVLVIGAGTGGTPYAAAANPATEKVRVIEIVAPVIDTLRAYTASGGTSGIDRLLADPRFEIRVADGRHQLALDRGRYDVIEADAILPKTGLSGLLNSREFFEQVRGRLAPGGLYVQWAPTERTVETFRSVFPYVTLVHPALIGSDRPIPYSRERMFEMLARAPVDDHLAAARIDRAELRRWITEKNVEVLNTGATRPARAPNTDFFPRDEFYLNR